MSNNPNADILGAVLTAPFAILESLEANFWKIIIFFILLFGFAGYGIYEFFSFLLS